jgi:hypothetical protein
VPVLNRAKKMVSTDFVGQDSPWGARFLGFVIEAMLSGLVKTRDKGETPPEGQEDEERLIIDKAGDTVFVPYDLINDLMESLSMATYSHRFILDALSAADVLAGTGSKVDGVRGFLVKRYDFNLHWSFRAKAH